jgi:ABC-type transport system involved in cytochrome bd biosynthesis fused ATPase/permease subunit
MVDPPRETLPSGSDASAPLPPERIAVEGLCVDYHGVVALHEASLRVAPGSICGLVGMNGAGKSTLFKALMGFVRPSRGTIRINGAPLAQARREQAVAYVPWRTCRTARSASSPAASASGPSWPGPWPRGPRCCCSMSPSTAWTSAPRG